MPWGVAAAAVGGALVSGYMGGEASEDAAHAQTQAAEQSAAVQREMYQTTRSDLAPYRDAGVPALQRLMQMVGIGGDPKSAGYGSLMKDFTLADFAKDPGYEFRKAEGEKALERGALARGMNGSTGTLKSLMRFNQGLASEEYGAAYGRYEAGKSSKFNLLSNLAGTGQNAAAMTGVAGTNMAAGTSQALMAGGAGAAGGIMGSASAWNNAVQGGISNYMYQKRFDDMMSRFPVMSGTPSGTATSNFEYTGTTAAGGNQYG